MQQDLQRFVEAQEPVYAQVCLELRGGRKRSHWMWFIFPQLAGLGPSTTARYFAIANAEHGAAYLAHPALGPRLLECVRLVNSHPNLTAAQMFGYPDDLKLRSSLTLFQQVAPGETLFTQALEQFYDNEPDPATLRLLQEGARPKAQRS